MHLSFVFMQLAGAVMLLLWAVRMVRTGVERANGPALRRALRGAKDGRLRAAFAGTTLAIALQSSTAVALLATGFAASGIIGTAAGLALLLGADVGSALVVKILSFDLSWLVPVLLFAGGVLFLKFEGRAVRQVGRILLGIAFILLSLRMIGEATEPLRHSAVLPAAIEYLRGDPVTAFAVAALLTWLIHSSVATILLLASFAAQGLLPGEVAIPLVLGANFGGGLMAVWLTRGQPPEAWRIPVGNLVFRGGAALAGLGAFALAGFSLDALGTGAPAVVNAHVAFNVALALVCLPLIGPVERLAVRLVPEPEPDAARAVIARPASALDRSVLDSPSLALASATRELLRMGETVEMMLTPVMDLIDGGKVETAAEVRKLDEEVNRAHTEIKLYVAEINRGRLSEQEARRGIELTDFAINLEHAGDIIAKAMLPLVAEVAAQQLRFSPEGWTEISILHARVLSNVQLALNVLVSGDLASARQLMREKEEMRRLERASHDQHLQRLQAGTVRSIETSDIHLELVRALKEINSLLATVAYPILSEHGQLSESRLQQSA